MKAIIIYESKYGNTKQVAEQIAEGIRQVRETEVTLAEVGQIDLKYRGELWYYPNRLSEPYGKTNGKHTEIN